MKSSNQNIILFLCLVAVTFTLSACRNQKQQNKSDMKYEHLPLVRTSNEIVRFDSITVENSKQAEAITIREMDAILNEIIGETQPGYENVVRKFDRMYNTLKKVLFTMDFLVEVHPDKEIRDALNTSKQNLKNQYNGILINANLFSILKKYSETPEAQQLAGFKKKFIKDILLQFKRSGMELEPAQREKLKAIRAKIEELGNRFSMNIAKCDKFLEVTAQEAEGLDSSYLDSRKMDNGNYKIDLSYPSARPFLRYCKNEKVRKELWRLFQNRGYPENEPILDSVLFLRNELANMLGYTTYAEYGFAINMAGTTKTVWDFENNMRELVKPKADQDFNRMLKIKSVATGKSEKELNEWEISYYENILKETQYKLDDRVLREYFELDAVINGLFKITQSILGLRYEPITNARVWHPEVRAYNCFDAASNKLIGRFYLDLFPRAGKYSHAAMFTITPGRLMENGVYEIPEAALVCNFSKPEGGNPSLLYPGEVETFFHEFGHLLHGLTTVAELAYQSGPEACLLDFVEAPSQIWENWSYDKGSLSLFAKHYKTGDTIPDELVDKLIAQKQVNSGYDAVRQLCFGIFALTLHDRYVPYKGESITALSHKLRKEIMGFTPLEDDHFECSFSHLIGYDAGYYAYMWSKVYAQDMWSVFEEKGALNAEIGMQYRQKVLSPGNTAHPLELVKNFLGREPNMNAMLKDMGVEAK